MKKLWRKLGKYGESLGNNYGESLENMGESLENMGGSLDNNYGEKLG